VYPVKIDPLILFDLYFQYNTLLFYPFLAGTSVLILGADIGQKPFIFWGMAFSAGHEKVIIDSP
jgi:hypothetical protein